MAITAEMRTSVLELYTAYFNRVADKNGVVYWLEKMDVDGWNLDQVAQSFADQTEYKAIYGGMTNAEIVATVYTNVLGRTADAAGATYWESELASGKITVKNLVQAVVQAAKENGGDDAAIVANKTAVSQHAFDVASNATNIPLTSVTADPATVDAAINGVTGAGETYTLTASTNAGPDFVGTAGNDTFEANIDLVLNGTTGLMVSTDTMQVTDVLVGGAGVDTLNYKTAGTVALGNISGIEIMNASSLAALTLDTSAITDLTNLNITKAVGAIAATAAATTDVTVAISEDNAAASTLANTVSGGKNVTVNATNMGTAAGTNADTIAIGVAAAIDPTGTVVVNQTGAAYTAATANSTLSAISVTGGTTINVTQKATSDLTAAASDTTNTTITQGAVTIAANTTTTAVTVKQDAAVTAAPAAATTGGVTETASVKFGAIKANTTVTLDPDGVGTAANLVFTSSKDMTAVEVAAAFANLVNDAAKGTVVAGDTQSAGIYTNGTYTTNSSLWTSGAATGDTVVFTSTTANTDVANIGITLGGAGAATSVAPIVTTTAGKAHDATIVGRNGCSCWSSKCYWRCCGNYSFC